MMTQETRYEREWRQVRDAVESLPEVFALPAFRGLECRAVPAASFMSNGTVQVVVEGRDAKDATRPWAQLGRTDIDELRRILRPVEGGL